MIDQKYDTPSRHVIWELDNMGGTGLFPFSFALPEVACRIDILAPDPYMTARTDVAERTLRSLLMPVCAVESVDRQGVRVLAHARRVQS